MIRKIGQAFVLDTAHTTYAFSILPGGHPEHLYYGRTIHIEHPDDLEILVEKHVFAPGNVNICEKEHAGFSLEDVRLEMSSYGKGDIREPGQVTYSPELGRVSGLLIGIPAALLWFLVFWLAGRTWFRKQVAE